MIKKLLIANRGEIAIRIWRTCRMLGLPVASVHSSADRTALHVRTIGESYEVGGPAPSASYLNIPAIIAAAKAAGADAVHPGIGFLSESPVFCQAVEDAGLIFVGPRPETLECFAHKGSAKIVAERMGVPVIGGDGTASDDVGFVVNRVNAMELPVILKAAAGGGGRGSRVVHSVDGLVENVESAMREARSAFGSGELIVETFIDRGRHVEVQVAGDGMGGVVHLYERECSLQRRFQKVLEEAPAEGLNPQTRAKLLADAVRLAEGVGYRGLGTIEFLVSGDRHYFLECNPRLQVEHCVTEEITGVDLVQLQLHIAALDALPFAQSEVAVRGHAVQARVYAEDPANGFMPSTGELLEVNFPSSGIRVESGVDRGSEITPYYDSLLAKLIVHAPDRVTALGRLALSLQETVVLGVTTNLSFLNALCENPAVRANEIDNRFIDRELAQINRVAEPIPALVAVAAAVKLLGDRAALTSPDTTSGLWQVPSLIGWRLDAGDTTNPTSVTFTLGWGDRAFAIVPGLSHDPDELVVFVDRERFAIRLRVIDGNRYNAAVNGSSFAVACVPVKDRIYVHGSSGSVSLSLQSCLVSDRRGRKSDGRVMSQMMGIVIKVNVQPGDTVAEGDVLLVQESMKMELSLLAPCAGQIITLNFGAGDMLERNALVVTIKPAE